MNRVLNVEFMFISFLNAELAFYFYYMQLIRQK